MTKQRYRAIDIAKGVGIILVVLGHTLSQINIDARWVKILYTLIYSFHMPLFFLLSGFVASKLLNMKTVKERARYIKGRAVRLLVPYFVIGFLYIPIKLKLNQYAVKPFKLSDTIKLLIGQNPDVALWFLYVLFIVSALTALFVNSANFRSVLYGAGALCAASWWVNIPFRVPKYFFFFLAGIWLRLKIEDKKKEGEVYLFEGQFLTFVLIAIVFLILNRVYFRNGINVLRFGASFCGIYMVLWLSEYLCRYKSKSSVTRVLEKAGLRSMDIYIIHEPVMTFMKILTWNILGMNYVVCTIIIFVCALLIPYPVSVYLIRRIPILRFLFFGERKSSEKKV